MTSFPAKGLAQIANAIEKNGAMIELELSFDRTDRATISASRKATDAIRLKVAKNKEMLRAVVGDNWIRHTRFPAHLRGIESVYRTS